MGKFSIQVSDDPALYSQPIFDPPDREGIDWHSDVLALYSQLAFNPPDHVATSSLIYPLPQHHRDTSLHRPQQ